MASGSGLTSRSRLALWCIERLPIADIRDQLEAASFATSGTKRVLVKWLYNHLTSRVLEPAWETGSEREIPHSPGTRPTAVITDLATWAEAWSTYAAVLVSFS